MDTILVFPSREHFFFYFFLGQGFSLLPWLSWNQFVDQAGLEKITGVYHQAWLFSAFEREEEMQVGRMCVVVEMGFEADFMALDSV